MLKPPAFWYNDPGWQVSLLSPIANKYAQMATKRIMAPSSYKADVPVICIGNMVMGGAGKTPLTQGLCSVLPGAHILSRGYGRTKKMSTLVDPLLHSYQEVGDEPLLLSQFAPTWVGSDRNAIARLATQAGAKYLLLDDGFQNPSLHKDLNLVVVDAFSAFGNEHIFPAGPLREPLEQGLERADALVFVGRNNPSLMDRFRDRLPVTMARVLPNAKDLMALHGQNVVAFAGLARPGKFYQMLDLEGIHVEECISFADHYPYTKADMDNLLKRAKRENAALVTTRKDFVRIPHEYREHVHTIDISVGLDKAFFEDLFHKKGITT